MQLHYTKANKNLFLNTYDKNGSQSKNCFVFLNDEDIEYNFLLLFKIIEPFHIRFL